MENNNFEIHSGWLSSQASQKDLFEFLSHIQNLEKILPKDKIQNIQATSDKISFEIENIIQLKLFIKEKYFSESNEQTSFIQYQSEPFGNYHLELTAQFQNNQSQIILSGYLNPFVLSIARKKLTYLVERINQELVKFSPNQPQ
ncbi:MAG: hypothetical protein AB1304_11120 [Bacteroidota bacterium]